MNKLNYLTDNDWELLNNKYKNMDKIIKKLEKDYPVQYLIGDVNFYGYQIMVNKNVLIPRFETETLIEKTITLLKKYNLENTTVLDIGTGSGCIPITLKKELPELTVTSIDKSRKALKIAKKNAKLNKTEINFIKKSIYKYKPINKYGLLISNPPYISESEVIDPKTAYEPQMALYAKNDGYEFYEYILPVASQYLLKKSILAFEIGEKQGRELEKMASMYFPTSKVFVEKDLANKDRYLFIINE